MLSAKRPSAAASQAEAPAFPTRPATSPLPAQVPLTSTLFPPLDGRLATGGLMNTQNRIPVVIKGDLKRPEPLPPRSREAHRQHHKRLWILGTAVLAITIAATLLAATPQGRDLTFKLGGNPAATVGQAVNGQQTNNGTGISAQATATWMYQNDGYDPYSHGQVLISTGRNSLPWPYGQCTYWANYEYHKESGFWVQWTGNADQWFLGAQKAGWDYAQKPPIGIPSIIVLMPYVQEAGWLGHVAVVESQTGNVVHTSNMNWGYGGSTHVEYVDFTLGPGVYFVWHPPTG
jgi:surface antigen